MSGALMKGTYPIKPGAFPAVGGSEGVGEVVAIGAGVEKIYSNASSSLFCGGDDDDDSGGVVVVPGMRVVPAEPGLGTWTTWGVLHASKLRALPAFLPLVEAAQLGVNPPTALRMLDDFTQLAPGGGLSLFTIRV